MFYYSVSNKTYLFLSLCFFFNFNLNLPVQIFLLQKDFFHYSNSLLSILIV